jgi:hypothetical protein
MRTVARHLFVVVACLVVGCSTMRPSASKHRGITETNPDAVVRAFPVTATLVSQRMMDVMTKDPILEKVSLNHDPANREFRNFSRAERQALEISPLTPANDVNFDIKAKCKDGQPVVVAIRLKGEAGCEVSVVYGFVGDPDLGRDLLDRVQAALDAPAKDEAVAKSAGTRKSASR